MSTESINLSSASLAPAVARPAVVQALLPAAPASAATEATEETDSAPLSKAVEELNRYVAGSRTDLRFSVDHDAGRLVVSIIDSESGQVLRQMPTAEALRAARFLEHDRLGLIRQRA